MNTEEYLLVVRLIAFRCARGIYIYLPIYIPIPTFKLKFSSLIAKMATDNNSDFPTMVLRRLQYMSLRPYRIYGKNADQLTSVRPGLNDALYMRTGVD